MLVLLVAHVEQDVSNPQPTTDPLHAGQADADGDESDDDTGMVCDDCAIDILLCDRCDTAPGFDANMTAMLACES